MKSVAACLLLLAPLASCTGALGIDEIRQSNTNAAPEMQIAEKCEFPGSDAPCRVIIQSPAPQKTGEDP